MQHKEVMSKLFDYNATTFYSWKKQNRPIISLVEKYFTDDELIEFISSGKVDKYDDIDSLIDNSLNSYIEFISKLNQDSLTLLFTIFKKSIIENIDFDESYIKLILDLDFDKESKNLLLSNLITADNLSLSFYFLKNQIKKKFFDFYNCSNLSSYDIQSIELKKIHIVAYIDVFENIKYEKYEEFSREDSFGDDFSEDNFYLDGIDEYYKYLYRLVFNDDPESTKIIDRMISRE